MAVRSQRVTDVVDGVEYGLTAGIFRNGVDDGQSPKPMHKRTPVSSIVQNTRHPLNLSAGLDTTNGVVLSKLSYYPHEHDKSATITDGTLNGNPTLAISTSGAR
eukprot:9232353-Pyramimonas_sp.AAC.2